MTITCIIVDDEAPARDELRYLLSSHEDIEVIGEAASAASAIQMCAEKSPDLMFLDIQMPGSNGFEVIETLMQTGSIPQVVFVTAYDSYAVQAFEASAVDYILKPVAAARLATSLARVRKLIKPDDNQFHKKIADLLSQVTEPHLRRTPSRISVEKQGRMRLLDHSEVVYCSYEDHRVLVHTFDEVLPVYGITSMDRLEEHLAGSTFFRAHRSTLVNMNAIKEFSPWFNGKYNLIMNDKSTSELTVSRSRVKDFKARLGL